MYPHDWLMLNMQVVYFFFVCFVLFLLFVVVFAWPIPERASGGESCAAEAGCFAWSTDKLIEKKGDPQFL